MNIGEIRKNANGQLIGSVETLTITRTIGLRPVSSSNPRAPKYEIVALNGKPTAQLSNQVCLLVLTVKQFHRSK